MLKENDRQKTITILGPKIYHLYNEQASEVAFGGAEIQLFLMGNALKENDYKVNVLVADFGQNKVEYFNGVNVIKTYRLKDFFLKKIFIYTKIFFRIETDYYIQRAYSIYTPLLVLFSKLRRKKYIYMVAHDSELDYKNIFVRLLREFVWKNAEYIFVQNSLQESKLGRYNREIHFLKNSHLIPQITEFGFKEREYLLWVGRSISWKRPELFIKIAKKFPNETFLMILNQANEGDKSFFKIKTESKNIENLKFIDKIQYQNIDSIYKHAKLFINTSLQEGFPNTFIDAGKWGVPIVSLEVDPDDFISKNECGYCAKGNWDEFLNNISTMLNNKKIYKSCSFNIYKYVSENHNIEKNIFDFIKIIER